MKRLRFVVIIDKPYSDQRAVGVYTSFKRADKDARAWDGYVLPLRTTEEQINSFAVGGE